MRLAADRKIVFTVQNEKLSDGLKILFSYRKEFPVFFKKAENRLIQAKAFLTGTKLPEKFCSKNSLLLRF